MEQTLKIIEANKQQFKIYSEEPLKVCAYCRVSTDEDDQKNSLKSQQIFFNDIFDRHKNWTNVGIFADEGISGTSLEKRDEFIKMLNLAKTGNVDIIITKEVSRFSRNAKDLLNIVDELKKKSVFIWFMSDDINTEDNNAIQQLTDLASSAQAESLRTSRRVLWGQRQQMQRGVVFGRKEMFAYNIKKDEHGKQYFEIIEDEAETVKKIFKWFSEGDGTHRIAKRLAEQGIATKRYKHGWSNTVILRILRNEKYVGDLAQGKTYTPNPLDHKKKYNNGQAAKYYITDHHPESAIISRDLWNKVQTILQEKAPSEEIKAKYSNRYWTSGKVFCGICGGRYVNYNKKQKNGTYKAWVCFANHQRGQAKEIDVNGEKIKVGCNGKRVNDRVLKMAIHDILTEIIIPHKQQICEDIIKELQATKKTIDNSQKIKARQKTVASKEQTLTNLTIKFAEGKIVENAYNLTVSTLNNELKELHKEISKLQAEQSTTANTKRLSEQYVKEVEKIVSLQKEDINEELYERITKKIIVFPQNVLEIYLSFLPYPIKMKYTTQGRGKDYKAIFTII